MVNRSVAAILFFGWPSLCCAEELNFVAQIRDGGTGIYLILGLSILMLAVSLERLLHFREKFIVPADFVRRIKPLWQAGQFAQLQAQLVSENHTLARIIHFMVEHRGQNYAIISSGAGDIASIELRHHQQKAYALAIVATVAPIVGLLGTVIGMIEAFHVIAFADGMGNPALLAGGISKALINTAAGLSVALPALMMHHFFKNRAAFFALALEKQVNQLLKEWFMLAPEHVAKLSVVQHAH